MTNRSLQERKGIFEQDLVACTNIEVPKDSKAAAYALDFMIKRRSYPRWIITHREIHKTYLRAN